MIAKQVQLIMDKKEMSSMDQLKLIFFSFFPQNRRELFLFLGLLITYFSYSLFFVLNSSLVDHPYQLYDIIFSFDNALFIHNGNTAADIHPLLEGIMFPFQFVATKLASIAGFKWLGIVMTFSFSGFIALGVVYIHRYIESVVSIGRLPLWILTFFYAAFFTNMILCFVVESYSISVCILAFMILIFSQLVQQQQTIKPLTLTFFTFFVGGVTVTNGLKSMAAYLVTKGKWKTKFLNMMVVGVLFLVVMLLMLWNYSEGDIMKFVDTRLFFTDIDRELLVGKYYENHIDLFFGAPIFSSSAIKAMFNEGRFANIGIPSDMNNARAVIVQDYYRYFWQYLWVAVLYLGVIISCVKNRKNKFVHMLILVWAVDFIVHIGVGYGMGEGFIYGGHWIYLIPLFLAWGYKSMQGRGQQVFLGVLAALFVTMLINNVIELHNTYLLALEYFPPFLP